ncbi:DNA polymerase/3'-5' exonuclease PolX [Filimonas sp.]|nr:DNA polymerase/3'-5' exonuclease PolX [Filimonas sp.]
MTNSDISDVFSLLSKLMDIHDENSFKSKTYANAAFQIDRLPNELSDLPRTAIASQKGVGESIAKKIFELLDTGELMQLNELIEKTPEGILDLLKIKGIGPKKISTIWKELGVESPGELLYACNENRLINYKGFGAKSQQSIKEALEFYFSNQERYLYAAIAPIARQLEQFFKRLFSDDWVSITGAFKRQCDIIDELEFVILSPIEMILEALSTNEHFTLEKEEDNALYYKFQGCIHITLYSCEEENQQQLLFFTTGTAEFNDAFDAAFPDMEYNTEDAGDESFFEAAGIQYIAPCLREEAGIIELAKEHAIPELIQASDIKGIIHNHSTWSDGQFSIEEMAKACREKGYEYLVMSDHSVTSFYANGLSVERIRQQQEEIDRLNDKLHPFKIFKSIECDILGDGRLDYEKDVLATFDLVITSIHQNLKMTEEKAMMRLMGAITNPYTRILGHPTGRLLLSRKEYPIDHKQLIDACKEHKVVIEINANPRRLDLDWRWIRYAVEQGVMLSINPDAHSIAGIDDVQYGVLSAQKGMMTAKDNLSSLSLAEFEIFLKSK